jgi:hypothetical protein
MASQNVRERLNRSNLASYSLGIIIDLLLYRKQANYINALAVSVSPFFEPAMPMTLGGLFVTLGGFWYDIG